MVKLKGVDCIAGEELDALRAFLEQCANYGIFIVDVGEVERWLSHLGCQGHGPDWLIPVFEKLGNDPADAAYIRPDEGDVWDFVRKIGRWISNPTHGMPT